MLKLCRYEKINEKKKLKYKINGYNNLKFKKTDTEQLEREVIEQQQQIERIKGNVGILFLFVLCGLIIFSILGVCGVFEKKKK